MATLPVCNASSNADVVEPLCAQNRDGGASTDENLAALRQGRKRS